MSTLNKGLYIVSTPIGNLEDISLRAVRVLEKSDFILCEDTRHSLKLLNHYKIKNKLIPYHKFNEKKSINKIIEYLNEGKILSLISDAGTPVLSDPGNFIINECIKMVRDKVGPVAAFKLAVVVKRLPKTRSGKILRGTVRKIADNEPYKMPATIDDPAILDEIKVDLIENNILKL